MDTPLEQFSAKTFTEQLHSRFKTHLSNSPIELELSEVEERNSSPRMELFFLRFRGPRTPYLPQQIYQMQHDKLGTFGLFLTAIGADEGGIDYEAVFNRLRKKPA